MTSALYNPFFWFLLSLNVSVWDIFVIIITLQILMLQCTDESGLTRNLPYHHISQADDFCRRKGQERWQRQGRRSLGTNLWWAHAFFPQLSSRDDSSKHGRICTECVFLNQMPLRCRGTLGNLFKLALGWHTKILRIWWQGPGVSRIRPGSDIGGRRNGETFWLQVDGNLPQRKLWSLIFGASALLQCEDMDSMDMMGQQQGMMLDSRNRPSVFS